MLERWGDDQGCNESFSVFHFAYLVRQGYYTLRLVQHPAKIYSRPRSVVAMTQPTNTALIFGGSGLVGANLTKHLAAGNWNVVSIFSRQSPPDHCPVVPTLTTIAGVDLTDPTACEKALRTLAIPTSHKVYVFYTAWKGSPNVSSLLSPSAAREQVFQNVLSLY